MRYASIHKYNAWMIALITDNDKFNLINKEKSYVSKCKSP
jgi:hypothetical protein